MMPFGATFFYQVLLRLLIFCFCLNENVKRIKYFLRIPDYLNKKIGALDGVIEVNKRVTTHSHLISTLFCLLNVAVDTQMNGIYIKTENIDFLAMHELKSFFEIL